jgi:hypothetical protein
LQLKLRRQQENILPRIADNTHPSIATLLRDCWNLDPSLRPSFIELNLRLVRLDCWLRASLEKDIECDTPTHSTTTTATVGTSNLGSYIEMDTMPTTAIPIISTASSERRGDEDDDELEILEDTTDAAGEYGSLLAIDFDGRVLPRS